MPYGHKHVSVERYTPSYLVSAARYLMGDIDLDPASSVVANEIVKAITYYDETMNGLTQAWHGRVFLNPPYGNTENKLADWISKAIIEYNHERTHQACLLLPAFTSQVWFRPLFSYPICFLAKRVQFRNERGETLPNPMYAHCVVYLPERGLHETLPLRRFASIFGEYGTCTVSI